MRDKEQIQKDIDSKNKLIEEASNKRLGFLLYSLQILGLKDTIKVGHFNFYASKHDTGVSVRVYIENEGETYDVINGTYWYNQSQYGHNKFTRNHGAWDSALESAIIELREKAKTLYANQIKKLNEEMVNLESHQSDKKKRFEALF